MATEQQSDSLDALLANEPGSDAFGTVSTRSIKGYV